MIICLYRREWARIHVQQGGSIHLDFLGSAGMLRKECPDHWRGIPESGQRGRPPEQTGANPRYVDSGGKETTICYYFLVPSSNGVTGSFQATGRLDQEWMQICTQLPLDEFAPKAQLPFEEHDDDHDDESGSRCYKSWNREIILIERSALGLVFLHAIFASQLQVTQFIHDAKKREGDKRVGE